MQRTVTRTLALLLAGLMLLSLLLSLIGCSGGTACANNNACGCCR